ncbi:MAG: hypothetical protein LBG29_07050 [Synergistaceae bacterium]|nr:hypothetical protein [Synergistaceae bacterium]
MGIARPCDRRGWVRFVTTVRAVVVVGTVTAPAASSARSVDTSSAFCANSTM